MQLNEMLNYPFVSIVICTYNRKKLLKDCLDSIFAMEYPKSRYKIIIVDGGSSDGTKELCKRFPRVMFVTEKRFGVAYARNKGAELAHGSVVAYTDDDCIVDKYWLKNLVSGFQFSESIIGVGGPVYPFNPEIIPQKILVKPALGLFDNGEHLNFIQCFITSNSAFKRKIFEVIKFDEKLGATRRENRLISGEDVDFCQTLVAHGHKLLYTPYAKVYHQISINRLRVAYILKHAFQGGIGEARILLKTRKSRIRALRYATGRSIQSLFTIFSERSFNSCYSLINTLSTLLVCLTGLETVL